MPKNYLMKTAMGAPSHRKTVIVSFATLAAVAVGLLLRDSASSLAMGFALTLLPSGVALVAYLLWLSTQAEPGDNAWSLHPARGVFSTHKWNRPIVDIPACLLMAAAGAAVVAYADVDVFHEGLPTPDEAGDMATVGAVLIQTSLVALLAELLVIPVVRRWGQTPPKQVTLVTLLALVVLTCAVGVPLGNFLSDFIRTNRHLAVSEAFVVWAPVVWVLIFAAATWMRASMVAEWNARLELEEGRTREAQQARRVAEAELAMLQAQIEPHFLYNTLASVQYLVRHDARGADLMLEHLVRYLRHAMPKLRRSMSTLAQECELADAYLQIARMRMGGRLTVAVHVPEEVGDIPFPPLVIQTLVENALKHGVEPKLGPVSIRVSVVKQHRDEDEGARLVVLVEDDGVGLGRANIPGSGTGLANVRERLSAIYGTHASLVVSEAPGGGVVSSVSLELPQALLQATSTPEAA